MWGYAGIITAFILLASMLLWLFIESPKTKTIFKIILVPVLLWYGIALYHAVPGLMGWPSTKPVPENSQVLAIRIKEPNPKLSDPGAIYFWINIKPNFVDTKQTLIARLNPKNVFNYTGTADPRAYKLPYSRKMHKAVVEAQRKMQGVPGARMKTKRGKRSNRNPGNEDSKANLELEIINPLTAIIK